MDCNCLDERMLSNSQLTQVRSLVQATSHETIEQTVAAAAQAASLVLYLLKLLSVPKRNALSEGKPLFPLLLIVEAELERAIFSRLWILYTNSQSSL